jgi:hypothetical protein
VTAARQGEKLSGSGWGFFNPRKFFERVIAILCSFIFALLFFALVRTMRMTMFNSS